MRKFGMLSVGVLAVMVSGCAADSSGALTTGVANGTIGEWVSVSPMPHGRANHCAAVIGDRVLVAGGNYKPAGSADFVTSDEVHVATIHADGTLGAWTLAGTLPSAVSACTATADDKRLLVMGGLWDSAGDGTTVWAASLSDSGDLSDFAAIGDLPDGATVLSSEAFATESSLLLFDTEVPEEGDETFLLRAPLDATLGEWERQSLVPRFLGYPQFAFDGAHAIVAGGYLGADLGNAVVPDVAVAGLGDAAAESASPMPAAAAFGRALSVDGHLFVLGGKRALFGAGMDDAYSAPLDSAGHPVDWTQQRPLPEGRTNFATVVAGDHLFVLGGGFDGPGLDTVLSARVRW